MGILLSLYSVLSLPSFFLNFPHLVRTKVTPVIRWDDSWRSLSRSLNGVPLRRNKGPRSFDVVNRWLRVVVSTLPTRNVYLYLRGRNYPMGHGPDSCGTILYFSRVRIKTHGLYLSVVTTFFSSTVSPPLPRDRRRWGPSGFDLSFSGTYSLVIK